MKYHLSTEGFYFKYRDDKYSPEVKRATLFNSKDVQVDDLRISSGWGVDEKSHIDVINYFEARITLQEINS